MSEQTPEQTLPIQRRVPMILSCAAFAGGIAVNEFLNPSLWFWSGSLVVGVLAFAFLQTSDTRSRRSVLAIAVCCFGAGGIRHASEFSIRPADAISRFAGEEPQPARIRARLLETPRFQEPREHFFEIPWKQQEFTSARVECLELNSEQTVSGQAILRISGAYSDAQAGDVVEILGHLSAPRGPVNPGEFDYRTWLDRQGIRALVRCQQPQQVRVVEHAPLRLSNVFPRLRHRLHQRLTASLPKEEAIVAAALLLGVRTNLSEETRRTFVRSGTFHLLAISGLHVGLLAYLLNLSFRLANVSIHTAAGLTVACLAGYLLLTEFRPSVFRAVVLISLYLFGTRMFRAVDGMNLLSVTALVMLVIRPAELFSAGAQLSFLAVLGIFAVQPLCLRFRQSASLQEQAASGLSRSPISRLFRWTGGRARDGLLLGIGVTLMTFPAMAYHFRLIAVWGIPLTVLLIPVIALSIGSGLAALSSIPVVSPVAATVLTWLLQFVGFIASSVADWSFSTASVSVSSAVWIGAYLFVASLPIWSGSGHRLRMWMPCVAAFAWGMTGGSPADPSEGSLRVTFLSVGHGLAIAIEAPDGSVHLYDAGSHDGETRAATAVSSLMQMRGKRKLETIFISHADFDHYSAIPELIERFEVGSVVSTREFEKSGKENVIRLRNFLRQRAIPGRTVAAGDAWTIGNGPTIRVLHPVPALEREYESENAASLVLELTFAGRRLLLTGDLTRSEFEQLRQREAGNVDCLLAPHHGSLADNPPQSASWANADVVVVSSGSHTRFEPLSEIYGPALEHTHRSGAVSVTISPRGEMTVERVCSRATRTED